MSTTARTLEQLVAAIPEPSTAAALETRRRLDEKTKPLGSLGRLEEVACRLAAIRGEVPERLSPAVVVVAADHGVAAAGVSAYPQSVTAEMLRNFLRGGAAVNVLTREAGARLVLVDAGVVTPVDDARIRRARAGAGTANFLERPAMSRARSEWLLQAGAELAAELAADGIDVVALGEIGIGNTTAAAAVAAALLGIDPRSVCGIGTGLDQDGVAHKVDVVRRALAARQPPAADPVGVLAAVGGFELAFLAGVVLGCAGARIPVVVDGFPASTAALAAARLAPRASHALLAGHRSPEPGHARVLDALALEPILDLELRLGEGTGAALALPLLASAVAIVREMATFESAGVSRAVG